MVHHRQAAGSRDGLRASPARFVTVVCEQNEFTILTHTILTIQNYAKEVSIMTRIRKAIIAVALTVFLSVPILAVPIAGGNTLDGDCQDIVCT